MSLVHALYPPHRLPAAPPCPGHDPACLVVCLPPGAGRRLVDLVDGLVQRLRPHVAAAGGVLDNDHFALWRRPDATERSLLVVPRPDPDVPGLTWCAGGPIGLLDLAGGAAHLDRCARQDLADWYRVVTGTPPAKPWWHYLDEHHADPDGYPLDVAAAEFEAQPRIAAMAAASGARFSADLYGPGLEALHAGPDVYADYQAGLLAFTDGLVTLDGQLLIPSFTPVLVEQTLAERESFHDLAARYVAGLDPTTLLVAVRCAR